MTEQNRVQPGVPEGGQFAATHRDGPDAGVVLAEPAMRTLPAGLAEKLPEREVVHALVYKAWRRSWDADADAHAGTELQLAGMAARMYEQHGVTGFGVSQNEGSEGSFLTIGSVQTDDGETHVEGEAFDAVFDEFFDIGVQESVVDRNGSEDFDSIALIEKAPALVEQLTRKERTAAPLGAADVAHLATLLSFAQQEKKVRWSDDDGETIRTGTMRTGTWDADGQPRTYEDIRAAHLRITTSTGLEIFRPVPDLAAKLADHSLAAR